MIHLRTSTRLRGGGAGSSVPSIDASSAALERLNASAAEISLDGMTPRQAKELAARLRILTAEVERKADEEDATDKPLDTALIETAGKRLQQNALAIEESLERLRQATTGDEKKAAAAERAKLEAKSPEELMAETRVAIAEAKQRTVRSDKYTDPEAVFSALDEGNTDMVRGSWLRDRPPGSVLPKRGELPKEALISVQELREIYAKANPRHKSLSFIALSHYWRDKKHPDPKGETLALLSKALKSQWEVYTKNGISDVGVFIGECYCQPCDGTTLCGQRDAFHAAEADSHLTHSTLIVLIRRLVFPLPGASKRRAAGHLSGKSWSDQPVVFPRAHNGLHHLWWCR